MHPTLQDSHARKTYFNVLLQTKRNHLTREANIVKAERNRNILNINLTLALLLGGIPFCAQDVLAADPVAQGSVTKTAKENRQSHSRQ